MQVQLENDKLRRESRGSTNLCLSSNAIANTMRQQNEQKASSRSIRNLNGLIIDSQGNSIPLSPVSSNTSSSSSDNVVDHQKPVPMTPSGMLRLEKSLSLLHPSFNILVWVCQNKFYLALKAID